jgi:BirA family transcriptional regulator, biotin operon repressor / biotin---[acetyl-CoA-carboxylase] ligase
MSNQIIGSQVIHLSETGSTNKYSMQLLKGGRPPEGTIVITDSQTQGRGMDTNTWESEPRKNLTFSIVLYPGFLPVEKQFSLNQAISLGLTDFVSKMVPAEKVTIKWPNDIYINDKKVCGTLIQNSVLGQKFDYVIAGIGLNINQVHFKSLAPNPVSMKNITGLEYNLDTLLNELCRILDNHYRQLKSGDSETIQKQYLSNLYRFNEWQQYSILGTECKARITGIGEYGQLLLQDSKENRYTCDLKEVVYLG